jgi:SNF2 family DNA or RNA helicase
MIYVSSAHSLLNYLQSQDRIHRLGQTHPVSYYHVLATGPKGERTIDHVIHKARQGKLDLATWTTAAWRAALAVE